MCTMLRAERVLSELNFLTGEGVNHYNDSCDRSTIEVLISAYLKLPTLMKLRVMTKATTGMNIKQLQLKEIPSIKINTRNHSKICIKFIVGKQNQ